MSLDSTAREANIRDSIKKYFVDSLYTAEGLELTFDKGLSTPKLQGHEVDRWVAVQFGDMDRETLSTIVLDVYCCTRKDSEGFRLAQLSDTVMGYLTDSTKTDGMRRVDFYRSKSTGAWTLLGALLVQDIIESSQFLAADETKYKILTCRLKWAAIV